MSCQGRQGRQDGVDSSSRVCECHVRVDSSSRQGRQEGECLSVMSG